MFEKPTIHACNQSINGVSLQCEPANLENETCALTSVANLRNVTTHNGCSATLLFSDQDPPGIRRQIAELLLRSLEKRSVAT